VTLAWPADFGHVISASARLAQLSRATSRSETKAVLASLTWRIPSPQQDKLEEIAFLPREARAATGSLARREKSLCAKEWMPLDGGYGYEDRVYDCSAGQ
jgi:hypothetical protein